MTTEQIYGPAPAAARPSAPTQPRRRTVRLVAWATVSLALLVLVPFVGLGWFVAGRIHDDAFVVRPGMPSYGQSVAAVSDGRVAIADPADEQPVLDGDAVWGLRWTESPESEGDGRDGYGQLHGDGVGGDVVSRELQVLQGDAPDVGDVVDLDRAAFPDDPEVALGVPVREVTVTSPLGGFPAWFADGDSSTWAILVHGKGGSRAHMLRMMRSTVTAGLPSLDLTYRNDPGVPASPDHRYGYGADEFQELAAAVRYAKRHGASDVVLVGASMGGAIVESYLERFGSDGVAGVVLDSPVLDLARTVTYGASQEQLPVLGQVPTPLTWVAQRLTTMRYGLDWDEVGYLDSPQATAVPTLLIHGDADRTVPIETSRDLAARDPKLVRLEVFHGAGHVASWNADPERYHAVLSSFLRRV